MKDGDGDLNLCVAYYMSKGCSNSYILIVCMLSFVVDALPVPKKYNILVKFIEVVENMFSLYFDVYCRFKYVTTCVELCRKVISFLQILNIIMYI